MKIIKAPTLDEYINAEARRLTRADLAGLAPHLPGAAAKAARIPAARHPRLRAQIRLAVRAMRLSEPLRRPRDIPAWRAELAVALAYFLKGADRIPDGVPEIGFADDARLCDRVFARNREAIETFAAADRTPAPAEELFAP